MLKLDKENNDYILAEYTDILTGLNYSSKKNDNNINELLSNLFVDSENFDVYIGTSYLFKEVPNKCGVILKYKFDFLIKHFPFLDPYKFIFVGDKSVINCDIRIDDRIDNILGADTKILYTAYHNKDLSIEYLSELKVKRVNNWLDIEKILLGKKD